MFSASHGLSLNSLLGVFHRAHILILMTSNISNFSLVDRASSIVSKPHGQIQGYLDPLLCCLLEVLSSVFDILSCGPLGVSFCERCTVWV